MVHVALARFAGWTALGCAGERLFQVRAQRGCQGRHVFFALSGFDVGLTQVLPDTADKAGALEDEGLFLALSVLARIATLANEGLDSLPGAEGVGDDD